MSINSISSKFILFVAMLKSFNLFFVYTCAVVTRPTNTEAPRPPSTSSIPSRKPVTEVSPPNSPTDINVRPSPERKGSNVSLDHKDTTIKPRRSAPPPPVLGKAQ